MERSDWDNWRNTSVNELPISGTDWLWEKLVKQTLHRHYNLTCSKTQTTAAPPRTTEAPFRAHHGCCLLST